MRKILKKVWIVMKSLMFKTLKLKLNIPREESNRSLNVNIVYNLEFVVTHAITIDVHETEKIGELADKLLKT